MSAPMFTRVLVGWDGSAGAVEGLKIALHLCAVDEGRVTALAVVPGFAHVEDADERALAADEVRTPLRDAFAAVASELPSAAERARLEFVEAPDVAKALDRYASTHPVQLVVVGLHGREGLLHPKMGHVASHAVRINRCPVMVVPEPGLAATFPEYDQASGSRLGSLFHPFRHRESVS